MSILFGEEMPFGSNPSEKSREKNEKYQIPWHENFRHIVDEFSKIEYIKRAKLLDISFSILPKRPRCDQIRFFCYYQLLVDYLRENYENFETEISEHLKNGKENLENEGKTKSHYRDNILMLDTYCEKFPAGELFEGASEIYCIKF